MLEESHAGNDLTLAKALLAGLGSSDPELGRRESIRLAGNLPPHEAGQLLLPGLVAWAEHDPQAAARAAAAGDPAVNRRGLPDAVAFSRVMGIWAGRDPAAAADFLKTQPVNDATRRAWDRALHTVAESRPQDLGVWLGRYERDIAREGTSEASLQGSITGDMAGVAEKWAAADAAGVKEFARSTPFPVLRRALLMGYTARLAVTDAAAAEVFAAEQPESVLREALRRVARWKQTGEGAR